MDPRCRSLKHLTQIERESAKKKLIDEVIAVTSNESVQAHVPPPDDGGGDSQSVKGFDIFDSPVKIHPASSVENSNEEAGRDGSTSNASEVGYERSGKLLGPASDSCGIRHGIFGLVEMP